MIAKPTLKSWSFQIKYVYTALGTTSSTFNVFQVPNNGVTSISPIQKNVRIRRVEAFTSVEPRSFAIGNGGWRANFWQVEFNIVDFAGQIIKEGFGFNNLFAPETGLSVNPLNPYYMAINETIPFADICVEGGGIYISAIKYTVGSMINPSTVTWDTNITVWYEDLECN